jgi:hypothetical protein
MDVSALESGFVRNSLITAALVFSMVGCFGTALTPPLAAEVESDACTLTRLPPEMQSHIQANYSSWQVQNISNLSASAKERWQSEKPLDCPGIAVGRFESINQKSYAVLLVHANTLNAGYRLLVFTPNGSHSRGAFTVIDQSDKIVASNFFIHQIIIGKVFDAEGVKRLRITTKVGILFVDAGVSEYEADVYSWTGDKYRHDPIDY